MKKFYGKTTNGSMVSVMAESRYEAIRILREQGYVIVSLEEK